MADAPAEIYGRYIDCLNARELDRLGAFVGDDVEYNGERIGLSGYRDMLAGNYRDIPDLRFVVALQVVDEAYVAARLDFNCTPVASFLGLPVNGRRVRFSENVFYEFAASKIVRVWSVIDKAAIEAQLAQA